MWLPGYEAIANARANKSRQPTVREYLQEFAMTKRQFATQYKWVVRFEGVLSISLQVGLAARPLPAHNHDKDREEY
jgi:hypothetical protein